MNSIANKAYPPAPIALTTGGCRYLNACAANNVDVLHAARLTYANGYVVKGPIPKRLRRIAVLLVSTLGGCQCQFRSARKIPRH